MRALLIGLLLLGAQLNLSALVPLQDGDPEPPWWVGGRLLWPFAEDTNTLLVSGDLLNVVTPILAILSAVCFLLAALMVFRRRAHNNRFLWLVGIAVGCSVILQVVWFTGWAILPLLIDAVLLWLMFGKHQRLQPVSA